MAHERAGERVVLRGEEQAVDQRPDHALAPHGQGRRARHERRPRRHEGGAPALLLRELREERGAALHVAHHDALDLRPEQPRERGRQLGRRLQPVGDEAEQRGVLRLQQGLHPRAHALEPRVQLLQRAEAAALHVQLVLRVVDGAVVLHRALAELLHLDVEPRPLVGGDALALGQLGRVAHELVPPADHVLGLEAQPAQLVLQLHPALRHLREPPLEARQRRLRARHRGLRRREPLPLIVRLPVGRALAVPQLIEPLVLLDRALPLARLLLLHGEELLLEPGLLPREIADAALENRPAPPQPPRAVLRGAGACRARERFGLVGAHLVVGEERGLLRLLRPVLAGERRLAHDLELRLPRAERGARRLLPLGLHRARRLLDLLEGDDLEQLVGGLVEDQVLQLVLVGDVALGLGGLALEGGEAPLESPRRCRRCAAGSAASAPSSARPASSAPCTW